MTTSTSITTTVAAAAAAAAQADLVELAVYLLLRRVGGLGLL
jgi:hypothetical protein